MKVQAVLYMLDAADMDRAVAFYRDTFGFGVKTLSPEWSELTWGDAVVAFHGGGDGEQHMTNLGIDVDDINAACSEVEKHGGRVVQPPEDRAEEGIYLGGVADTEGNVIWLSQAK